MHDGLVYFRYKTDSGLVVYDDKEQYFVPVSKGLGIEKPYDLRAGRRLKVFSEKGVPV